MPVQPLNIFSYYNVQRFIQSGSMDCANWYTLNVPDTKSGKMMYPAMGRKHVNFQNSNRLIFDAEPRAIFKSINYMYVVVGTRIFQIDRFYKTVQLSLNVSAEGDIWASYLPVETTVYVMLTDGKDIFVITEPSSGPTTIAKCTDLLKPSNPTFICTFGNRFVVSTKDTPIWTLSQINLGDDPSDPATWFSIPDGDTFFSLFASASGIVRQLGTLHNQLYIFTDFTADIWSNIPTVIQVGTETRVFPFKLSSAYNWDFGIADPHTLSIDFGMMVWLGKNRSGLVTFMVSRGAQPQPISTQAINVLLESQVNSNGLSPFLSDNAVGFLYQWENTVFYRVSAGKFLDFGQLDLEDSKNALEFNFNTQKWHRLIEINGERNRIQKHVFFNNKHFVTVEDQTAVYEMRGDVYTNELQLEDNPQAFKQYPMRYELTTSQIYQPDYSEFKTTYVEIDFVFGEDTFVRMDTPFSTTTYITDEQGNFLVTEESTPGTETFLIEEGTNFPTEADSHYNELYKPHIELYWSDDGGITFHSADVREFSNLGVYRWRMRWYELGVSRNRVYKLVCVSGAPIVILSAVHNLTRVSGGAN